ncbi:hypothetical protein As57867_019588, partial [Aphanomyces stellatus]
MSAAELSVHVRGIAEKLRKRAEDAAKKNGMEASAGLFTSVDHLLQSADLMERQQNQLAGAAYSSSDPAPTIMRNLQLVGAMLEKKSDEMKAKQAVGPANSLAQSASHVRIGVQRLEVVQAWLQSTLGDAFSPEMEWSDAFHQITDKIDAAASPVISDTSVADATAATIAALEAELAQWKEHHTSSQAQHAELMLEWEKKEVELATLRAASSVQSNTESQIEALQASLAAESARAADLMHQLKTIEAENAKAEAEMQEEWERTLKKHEGVAHQLEEWRARCEAQTHVSTSLADELEKSQRAFVELSEKSRGTIAALEDEIDTHETRGASTAHLADSIQALHDEKARFEGEIARLEAEVAAEQAIVARHADHVRALEVQVDKTHQMHAEMRSSHEEMGLAMQEESAALKHQVRALEGEKTHLEQQLEALTDQIAALETDPSDDALEGLQTEVAQLTHQLAAAEEKRVKDVADAAEKQRKESRSAWDAEKFELESHYKVLEEQYVKKLKEAKKQLGEAKDEKMQLETAMTDAHKATLEMSAADKAHWEAEAIHSKEQVATLLQKVANAEAKVQSLELDARQSADVHHQSVEALKQQVAALDSHDALQHELTSLQDDKAQLLEQVANLKQTLEDTIARVHALQEEADERTRALEALGTSNQDKLAVLVSENSQLVEQVATLNQNLSQREMRVHELQALASLASEEHQRESRDLQSQVDALRAKAAHHDGAMVIWTDEKAQFVAQVAMLKQTLDESATRMDALQGDKEALEHTIDEFKHHVHALEASSTNGVRALEEAVAALEADKAHVVAQLDSRAQEVATLQQTLADQTAHHEALQHQVNETHEQALEALKQELAALQGNGATDSELAALLDEKAQLLEQVATLQQSVAEATDALAASHANLDALARAHASAESEWVTQVATLQQKANEFEFEKMELTETLAKHQDFEAKAAHRMQEFVDKINALVTEKTELQAAVETSEAKVNDAAAALAAATAEKQKLADDFQRQMVQWSHDQTTDASQKQAAAETEARIAAEMTALTSQVAALQEEKATLKALEVQLLTVHASELQHMGETIKVLEGEKAAAEAAATKVTDLMVKINDLSAEKRAAQARCAELEAQGMQLTAQVRAMEVASKETMAATESRVQDLSTQIHELEAAKVAAVDAVRAAHAAEVAQWKAQLEEAETQRVASLSAVSSGASSVAQERDQTQSQLKQVEAAFEAYKTRAAAALKKAERRSALLNPMLAEKQELETKVSEMDAMHTRLRERHENDLLAKEETITRLTAAVDAYTSAMSVMASNEDAVAAVQAQLEAKVAAMAALESQVHALAATAEATAKEAADAVAQKEAEWTASLEAAQTQIAALTETLELKTLAVTKAMRDKADLEAVEAALAAQLDETKAQLHALVDAEATWKAELEAYREGDQAAQSQEDASAGQKQVEALAHEVAMRTKALDEMAAAKAEVEAKLVDAQAQVAAQTRAVDEWKAAYDATQAAAQAKINGHHDASSSSSTREEEAAAMATLLAAHQAETAALAETAEALAAQVRQKDELIAAMRQADATTWEAQVAAKDEAIAALEKKLEVEIANEKLAFEATKLLKSQLEEKDSYVQLVKQNAELRFNQTKLEFDAQLQRELQERDAAVAAMKAQLVALQNQNPQRTPPEKESQELLAAYAAKVAELSKENDGLRQAAVT